MPWTEPGIVRPSLTPVQDFRVNVARGDLERVRNRDLATISNASLLLEGGALISSPYAVLAVLDQVAEVHPVIAPAKARLKQAPREDQVLSPNCRTALHPNTPDDWPQGHPACQAPGYRHPVLGWMRVVCTCGCHDDQAEG